MTVKKLGLSGKVLIGITLLFLLITVTMSAVSSWNLDRRLTHEFETKGMAIAGSVANSSVELLLARNGSSLQAMIDEFLEIRGVGYVLVVDGDHEIVAHTFVPAIPAVFSGPAALDAGSRVDRLSIAGMGDYLDVTAPILAGMAGVVHVGMDRSVIQREVRSAVLLQGGIMLAIFAVSMTLAYAHVTRVTRPLHLLTAHANQVASQERLDEAPDADGALAHLATTAEGEVGELAIAFQHMEAELRRYIANLRRAQQDLEEHNRTLEQKVDERTRELQDKNGELQNAISKLEQAQDQIVKQEKLASLGALTAGIAHEIKNPLNFINNFAQLSTELAAELKDALGKPIDGDAAADMLDVVEMLETNVQKINEHGKRADSIVRNMLQHSRSKKGEWTAVDVNALLGEYVGLAYHGMRGQDQSFNAKIEGAYDPAVGTITAIPQDLSRAFLNILTNACYAIHDRKKQEGDGFAPLLAVKTRSLGDSVEIRIRDNGKGIPPEVKERMFEPFFTTKPAGSGTGLGLSMTFDIIKAHKGGIDIDTAPGHAEFIITLPRQNA